MGRKHLLPAEHNEYLERIGLTDYDKKVYIATLDSGLVTVGEIQQLIKIDDLSKVIDSLRDLIDIGLIKKAQGKMPRYYAILPFMRETITIEKEFTLALDSMIQSILKNKLQVRDQREEISLVIFPKLIEILLDEYYNNILSPTIDQLEKLKEATEKGGVNFLREIQTFNSNLLEEILLMMKPSLNLSKVTSDLFDKMLNKTKGELEEYNKHYNEGRGQILQKAYSEISEKIKLLNEITKNHSKSVIDSLNPINELGSKIKQINKSFNDIKPMFNQFSDTIIKGKNELITELDTTRQNLVANITKLMDDNNNLRKDENINKIIEEEFHILSDNLKNISVDSEKIKQIFEYNSNITLEGIKKMEDVYQNILLENSNRAAKFKKSITNIGKDMSEILSSLNDKENTAISNFTKNILEMYESIVNSIAQEGKQNNEKIDKHQNKIKENFQSVSNQMENVLLEFYAQPSSIVSPIIEGWIDKIKPAIDEFKEQSNSLFNEVIDPIVDFENNSISTIVDRIRFVKVMVEGRSNDLSSIVSFAKSFDYTKSSDTWVVVGLPSIYASITDMILRSRSKITIVIPNIDLELFEIIRKIRSTIRVTIVTDIDPQKDARLISKVSESGRIELRAYDKKDLYACIRDAEEIILGYKREDEEMIGIRASTPSIVELLKDRLNETVIRYSKTI